MSTEDETYKKLLSYRQRTDLSLKPCSRLKPSFVSFDGKEHPLKLRYYQVQGILHLLAMKRFLLGDDTGLGKCAIYDTLIKTGKGLRSIEKLNPGAAPDTFYPLEGETVFVGKKEIPVSGFYNGGEKRTIKIKTRFGYELEGTMVHPVLVRGERGEEWVRLSQIKEGDYICIDRSPYSFGINHIFSETESPSEKSFPIRMTPELARCIAYVVAQGSIQECRVQIHQYSCEKDEIAEDLRKICFSLFGENLKETGSASGKLKIYEIRNNAVVSFLGTLGVKKEKVIPWSILQSDRECVKHFVRTLVSCGASILGDKIKFISSSKELVKQLQIVLLGFGILSQRYPEQESATSCWHLIISGEDIRNFVSEIGLESIRNIEDNNLSVGVEIPKVERIYSEIQESLEKSYFYDPVVSIEESFGQVYDLTVDDPGHSFVGNGFVNHNTLMSIASLCYIWEKRPEERAIILTDKSAVAQWESEFIRFTEGVTVVTIEGSPKKRQAAYEKFFQAPDPAVLITNYRKPVIDFEQFQPLQGFTLITDEATAYKNPNTQIHQACKYLSSRANRVWALTATLIKNNLLEGYGIYRVLVPKLFQNKRHFIENYTIHYMQKVPGTNRKVPIIKGYRKSHIDSFKNRIDRYFIGRAKWEVAAELPALTTKHLYVPLSREQSLLYEEALSGLLRVGEGEDAEDREVTKLTSLIYCQQIVNDPRLIERTGKSKKLSQLLDLLEEGDLSDEKVIVFTRFKKMVDLVVPLLNELHKDRERYAVRVTGDENTLQRHEAMTLFQDPESQTRVIVITMAGAAAINLQAAKAVIFYDSPWSAGDYLQILGRMIRIGSVHDNVYAIHLISKDGEDPTIDGRTQEVLLSKMDLIEKVLGKKLKTDKEEDDYEVSAEDDITDLFRILQQDAVKRIK